MICFLLFFVFFQIGALSFGGGYGMISMIREKVLLYGWLSESELLTMIAVSESTPGPLAVNMATYIGAKQGGIPGAISATLGVVMPAFCIILLIACLLRNVLQYRGVQAFLGGVRPCVVGLIAATAIGMFAQELLQFRTWGDTIVPDWRGVGILGALAAISWLYEKRRKKGLSPIVLILISAGLGAALY